MNPTLHPSKPKSSSKKRAWIIGLTAVAIVIGIACYGYLSKIRSEQVACAINQNSIRKAAESHCSVHVINYSEITLEHLTAPDAPFGHFDSLSGTVNGFPECPNHGMYSIGLDPNAYQITIECSHHGKLTSPLFCLSN